MAEDIETLTTAEAVVERLSDLARTADHEMAVSVPAGTLPSVRESLRGAVDDGVLVLLLVSGYDPFEREMVEGVTTVARHWEGHAPLTCTVDGERALFAPGPFIAGERVDRPAAFVDHPALTHALFGEFVANYWLSGSETYTVDPTALPRTFENFRHAVVQTTLRLRERETVHARVEGRPVGGSGVDTIAGTVVNARQSLLYPVTSSFPAETSLGIRTTDGLVRVGGWGAFVEDYEAEMVTLEPA
jgi:hypothetical protein